jgi:DNA processing protein
VEFFRFKRKRMRRKKPISGGDISIEQESFLTDDNKPSAGEFEKIFGQISDDRFGFNVITKTDEIYPVPIKRLMPDDCPKVLYCYGNTALLENETVMICGSRNASQTGNEIAYNLSRKLAKKGITIASGFARGIDMAAHYGALENGGNTIAFLPYGLYRFRLNQTIRTVFNPERVLLITELPFYCIFTTAGALRRNKLLAALSGTVMVIEPGDTGGTWFSAAQAVKFQKPLYYHEGERKDLIAKLESFGGKRIGEGEIPLPVL